MVNTSLRYQFLLRRVSASQYTLLAGCGMSHGFTIYGTEGHISRSTTGSVVQYSEVDIQAGVYYYIPDLQGKSYFDIPRTPQQGIRMPDRGPVGRSSRQT